MRRGRSDTAMHTSLNKSRAVVSVAVREPYATYGVRLDQTLRQFGCCEYVRVWDRWPNGGPTHFEHHYAFKFFAMKAAADLGYRRLLWLDSACYAIASLGPIWEVIEEEGQLFLADENALGEWASDRALARYGVTRDEAMGLRFFSGTFLGLNLDSAPAQSFFEEWGELAKVHGGDFMGSHREYMPSAMRSVPISYGTAGEIVSEDPRCLGHRSDEVYFALMARKRGMPVHNIPNASEFFNTLSDKCVIRTQGFCPSSVV